MTSNIKRAGARTHLAIGAPVPFIRNRGTDGLEFCFDITDPIRNRKITVALAHVDRDRIIERWAQLETEFEQGPGS